MRFNRKTILLILIIFSRGISHPIIECGIKISRYTIDDYILFSNGSYFKDVFQEIAWGLSGEYIINFTKHIALRSEPVEMKLLDNGGSHISVGTKSLFDIIVRPLHTSKFSPYIYCGGSYEKYSNLSYGDYRGYGL